MIHHRVRIRLVPVVAIALALILVLAVATAVATAASPPMPKDVQMVSCIKSCTDDPTCPKKTLYLLVHGTPDSGLNPFNLPQWQKIIGVLGEREKSDSLFDYKLYFWNSNTAFQTLVSDFRGTVQGEIDSKKYGQIIIFAHSAGGVIASLGVAGLETKNVSIQLYTAASPLNGGFGFLSTNRMPFLVKQAALALTPLSSDSMVYAISAQKQDYKAKEGVQVTHFTTGYGDKSIGPAGMLFTEVTSPNYIGLQDIFKPVYHVLKWVSVNPQPNEGTLPPDPARNDGVPGAKVTFLGNDATHNQAICMAFEKIYDKPQDLKEGWCNVPVEEIKTYYYGRGTRNRVFSNVQN